MIPPRLRRSVSPNTPYHVSFHDTKLTVTATKRAAEVDRWINRTICNHRHHLQNLVVGLDIEWHPCKPWESNPVATLQLCVGHSCLVFQLLHRDYIPVSLLSFLANPLFTFVGVGVLDDVLKLSRDHGLAVGKVVDLRDLAACFYGSEEFLRLGLKKMALVVLEKEMEKSKEVTMSDWDAKNLSFEQIKYGSIDALVSFQIGFKLFTKLSSYRNLSVNSS